MSITPYELLLRLIDRGHRPGALIGDWFGHQAIVAVDLDLLPCHPDELFPADGAWFFGYRPYSARQRRLAHPCSPRLTTATGASAKLIPVS